MFSFQKKSNAIEKEAPATTARDEFIPYYAHYNPHTLITKNGELMQIIKIASNRQGLNYESGNSQDSSVREILRKAATACITQDCFSLWVHTVRKRRPIQVAGAYAHPFASYVYDHWQSKHHWQYHYYNEVYISVLREGQSAELANARHLQKGMLRNANREYRWAYLDEAYRDLDKTVTAMLQHIRPHYNAHLLAATERLPAHEKSVATGPVFYSEPMEFLSTLLNLSETPRLLPEADIAKALDDHLLTFGYNAMESKSASGKRRFAALLTLKHYQETPPETIDRVLQSPCELIVSQSFVFTSYKHALKPIFQQKEMFEISGDSYSRQITGIDDVLRGHQKRPIDFGEQQISIAVIVDEYRQLDGEVNSVQETFGEMGMTTVREDIMLEDCFWAQLPGNFEFIRRKDPINTPRMAGLCRLNRFPTGNDTGNHWNEALAVMPTQVGSPYFFSFHHQDSGHTLLMDFNSFNDQTGKILLNFLLTAALKYKGRTYVFDRKYSSRLLCNKLGADYLSADESQPLALNPLGMDPTPRNLSFMVAWCQLLVDPHGLSQSSKEHLRAAVDAAFAAPPQERSIAGLTRALAASDAGLAASLEAAIAAIPHCRFDAPETFGVAPFSGVNMDMLMHMQGSGGIAVFAYLLHRIIASLDGSPTIIVLNEAVALLENAFFAPRMESLLEMLTQSNAMLLCTVSSPQIHTDSAVLATLLKRCPTRLYLPDEMAQEYDAMGLSLSPHDARMLERMRRAAGDFLVQQGNESIALKVNIDDMPDVKAIFANDIKTLITAGGPFASLSQQR